MKWCAERNVFLAHIWPLNTNPASTECHSLPLWVLLVATHITLWPQLTHFLKVTSSMIMSRITSSQTGFVTVTMSSGNFSSLSAVTRSTSGCRTVSPNVQLTNVMQSCKHDPEQDYFQHRVDSSRSCSAGKVGRIDKVAGERCITLIRMFSSLSCLWGHFAFMIKCCTQQSAISIDQRNTYHNGEMKVVHLHYAVVYLHATIYISIEWSPGAHLCLMLT